MRLSDDDIREVLARAEEIRVTETSGGKLSEEMEAIVQAGEEVGIPRFAIERAFRERLNIPDRIPSPGDLVFAKSVDNKFYVAEVLNGSGDELRVRYLRGGERTVAHTDFVPAEFLPGQKVVVNWPWWGEWNCSVVSYDSEFGEVTVNDGFDSIKTFPVAEIWLNKRKPASALTARRRAFLGIAGTSVAIGGALGALITFLIMLSR
jgi:hypothetical protein